MVTQRLQEPRSQRRWVLLAYRLPREPSTPRIGVWRQLRRLGVAQVADGLVALPHNADTQEQLEWIADDVVDHGGEASIWLAEAGTIRQERALAQRMNHAVDTEYRRVIDEATALRPGRSRGRSVGRLRRELRRIGSRDYFSSRLGTRARKAVEGLVTDLEAAS